MHALASSFPCRSLRSSPGFFATLGLGFMILGLFRDQGSGYMFRAYRDLRGQVLENQL